MADYTGAHTGAEVDDGVGAAKGAGTGVMVKTGSGTGTRRTITGTTDQITVTNGDGVAGNPTISLPSAVTTSLGLADSAVQPADNISTLTNDSGFITAASTSTLTNKTFDANGTGNSISNIEVADLASAAKTGADTRVVTGTAGTAGNLVQWNADGDAVDAAVAVSLLSSAVQPGDDAADLGSGAATDGYVLTADGLGGAAWEAAAGGATAPLTLASGTITASDPALVVTQTWNGGAVAFTAIDANITNTASASASYLLTLRIGGTTKASITKDGQLGLAGGGAHSLQPNSGWLHHTNAIVGGGYNNALKTAGGLAFPSVTTAGVEWQSYAGGGTNNLAIYYEANNVLAQRNSTAAQTYNIYNTYTDASNYERGGFRWNSNILEVRTDAAGTGSSRDLFLNPAGSLMFGTHSAIGAETVTGFITIKDAAGNTRKLAVVS